MRVHLMWPRNFRHRPRRGQHGIGRKAVFGLCCGLEQSNGRPRMTKNAEERSSTPAPGDPQQAQPRPPRGGWRPPAKEPRTQSRPNPKELPKDWLNRHADRTGLTCRATQQKQDEINCPAHRAHTPARLFGMARPTKHAR